MWVGVMYLYGNIQHEARLSGVRHTHDPDAVSVTHTHLLQNTAQVVLTWTTFCSSINAISPVLVSPYRRATGSVLESWTHTRAQTTRPWLEDRSDSELRRTQGSEITCAIGLCFISYIHSLVRQISWHFELVWPVYFQLTSSRWSWGSLGMCFLIQDQQWTCWSVGEMMKKLKKPENQSIINTPANSQEVKKVTWFRMWPL